MLNDPRLPICVALLVLTCGQALLWRRRDNVFAYLQGGLFFSTVFAPLFATTVVSDTDPAVVDQYVRIMLVGALAYGCGLCFGAPLGKLSIPLRFTFTVPFARREVPRQLRTRGRRIAVLSGMALISSFVLLGYVPLLAADRSAAKYGIGIYAAGFGRGAILYHLALAATGVILPIMLAVFYRGRRGVDLAISGMLGLSVLVTLSRGDIFYGPLLFVVAFAVERRVRSWLILAVVCVAFVAGALANELVYTSPPTASPTLATRVSESAPDLRDQLGFLQGFRLSGEEHIGLRTITSAMGVSKGEWDPASYAMRILTGLHDVSGLAAGGIRLPAPLWGYAAYGLLGTIGWSFVSGLFTGWGTVKLRDLLSPVRGSPGVSLNLVLAATFYAGTFGLLATFYFPERSGVVVLLIALALCVGRWARRAGADDPEPGDLEPDDPEPGDREPGDREPGEAAPGPRRPPQASSRPTT